MRDLKNNSFQSAQHLSESIKNNVSVFSFESIFFDDSKNYLKIKNSDINSEGNYPVIDQGEKFLAGYTDIEPKILKEEDCIVFGDHSKIFKFVNFPFVKGADGTKVLKIKNKNFNTKYFYYFFQSLSLPDLGYTRYYKILKETNVPVLSISQQNKLVNILDRTDELIIIRKEQIQAYDDLIESLFFEMFGNPITNSKHFKTNKFINVVRLKRGYDLPVKSRVGNKYEVYGSNGVLDGHNEFKVEEAGVITGRSGTIGKVFRNEGMYWPLNTTLYSEKTYGNNVIFLEYLLKNFKLDRFATGTGVPTLNRNIVHKEEIIEVPIELQNKFADYVLKIEEEKKKLNSSLLDLENLFDSLMENAFSGNLFKD